MRCSALTSKSVLFHLLFKIFELTGFALLPREIVYRAVLSNKTPGSDGNVLCPRCPIW